MNAADDARTAQDSVRDQLVAAARREPDPSRTAQTALRDALVAAGVREYGEAAAARRTRRRRRRRATGAVVVALLGGAAAASATGLISVGEEIAPLADLPADDPRYARLPGGADLAIQADDPDRKLNWGVAVYTSRDGRDCLLAGQVRGNLLGLERNGTFHPYSNLRTGACGDLKRMEQVNEIWYIEGRAPRTLVYGRTATPDKRFGFRLKSTGEERTVKPGRGGAYLFVYEGRIPGGDFEYVRR